MRACNLSQSALARRVGVSQQTIWKLINGTSRTSGHVARIARALKTTAAYLEGETDDPTSEAPDVQLTTEEAEVLAAWRQLSPDDRKALRRVVETMALPPPATAIPYRGEPIVTTEEGLRATVEQALTAMPRRRDRQADYLTAVLGSVLLPPQDLEPGDEDHLGRASHEGPGHAPSPTS
jgi:transcriptional regulator with XRE-family HTH domain